MELGLRSAIAIFILAPVLDAQAILARFNLTERFGVSHPAQPVEFSYNGAALTREAFSLLGPGGEMVPFQRLSTGSLLIRTPLPASRIGFSYKTAQIDPRTDTITINLNMLAGANPTSGDVVQLSGANVPRGIVPSANYFLKQISAGTYRLCQRKDLSDTVRLLSSGDVIVHKQGWIVDPDDPGHTLYARDHRYRTGDPILLKSSGVLPSPLVPNCPYFAIRRSENTFQLAASRSEAFNGSAIALATLGTGIFETTVDWTWTMVAGKSPAVLLDPRVQLADAGDSFTVTNGLTGVRVLKPVANPRPFNRAPIQGIRLADGSWTATGPNYLYESYSKTPASFLTEYKVKVVESGPLLVRLEASYRLNRPEYTYGSGHPLVAADPSTKTVTLAGNEYYWNGSTSMQFHRNGGTLPCGLFEKKLYWPLTRSYNQASDQTTFTLSDTEGGSRVDVTCAATGHPTAQETMNLAGLGYFKETISLYAGHKSVVIEDDTDSQLQYFLNFYKTGSFVPDQARYRGHASTSIDCGYSLQGSAKTKYVPYSDAFFDISYRSPKDSSYVCNSSTDKFAPVWYMANSGYNTGWYWQFYDSQGSGASPLVGYYLGRTSRYLTPLFAGPGLYTSPAHFAANDAPAAGITMHVALRGPDGRSTQRTRREWVLYVSTKADLADSHNVPPIGIERNVLAGINLTRLATYVFEYPDPRGGWPAPYADSASYRKFVNHVRTDSRFRNDVNATAPELRDLVSMWQGNSAADIELVVSHLQQFAYHWLNILVNQNGNFDSWWHYYQPGLVWEPLLTRALVVLNSSVATPFQIARTKAVAALAASIFWDDDYVPWDVDSGEGTGNANQGDQYSLYRAQNALMLLTQPLMAKNQTLARRYAESVYLGYLHPVSGVPRGSTHYHSAAMDPTLANFLDLKNEGADMNLYPRWRGYGRWMLSALTPPEPRFGNTRKLVSLGDGNTEASAMPGMVATLLRSVDPTLSAQLQWEWNSENSATVKTYGEFSTPSMLVIDPYAAAQNPKMRSENYAGYWSVLRHGFDSPNETVAWFVNGDFYSDHRHGDSGQVTLYAHAAPLAVDWNPNLYYPHVGGGIQHNRVIRESEIGQPWNADNLSLDAGANWGSVHDTQFSGFDNASDSQTSFLAADGTIWTRGLTILAPNLRYPIIYTRDHFTGAGAASRKVLTWNLMAGGAVDTPVGKYSPIERFNDSGSSQPNALPSNGPDYPLGSGLQHFAFTGQYWPAHATKGIDWDLYLLPEGGQRFYIGAWGHDQETSREQSDYQKTNGTTFRESQWILRVLGNGSFTTIMLPYRKGEEPVRSVRQDTCGIRVAQGDETLCFGERSYQFSDASRMILTTFDSHAAQFGGMSVSGGPTEVVLTGEALKISASGAAGRRYISVPGTWVAPEGLAKNGSTYTFEYAGGDPIAFTLTK